LLVIALSVSASAAEDVVVLPTATAGFMFDRDVWVKAFDRKIVSVLARARMRVLHPTLSLQDAGCRAVKCMKDIADRTKADVIVAATVANDELKPPTYNVRLLVFDKSAPDTFKRDIAHPCPRCSEEDTAKLLSNTMSEALEMSQTPSPERPPSGELPDGRGEPNQPPPVGGGQTTSGGQPSKLPPAPLPPPARSLRRPIYLTLGSIGTAGTVASIIALGVKAHENGQLGCSSAIPAGRQCPYVKNTTGAIVASSTVGALSLGLAIYSFVKAAQPDPPRRAQLVPLVGSQMVGVGIEGVF